MSGRRRAVRRFLDLRGFVPGFEAAHDELWLRARDGVRLRASYLRGPTDPRGGPAGPSVVLAHGFAAHRRKPAYALLAERLARVVSVLTLDLRGHGQSGGASTLGDRETLDVQAASAWLRSHGHSWVGLVGVSMGGVATLRAAAALPGCADAVCAVSAPAVWGLDGNVQLRALLRLLEASLLRAAATVTLGVRMTAGWRGAAPPVAIVGELAPTPLLVVHGADDHFFGPQQARLLWDAAGEPRALWLEPPGFGHAEDGLSAAFGDDLAAALVHVHRRGAWPEHRPERSLQVGAAGLEVGQELGDVAG